jgi:hypothetical protein
LVLTGGLGAPKLETYAGESNRRVESGESALANPKPIALVLTGDLGEKCSKDVTESEEQIEFSEGSICASGEVADPEGGVTGTAVEDLKPIALVLAGRDEGGGPPNPPELNDEDPILEDSASKLAGAPKGELAGAPKGELAGAPKGELAGAPKGELAGTLKGELEDVTGLEMLEVGI